MKLEFKPPECNPLKKELDMLLLEFDNMLRSLPQKDGIIDWTKVGQSDIFIKRFMSLNNEEKKLIISRLEPELPYNLSSFGFVGMFLGFMVADDAVRTKFLDLDSRWGTLFNSLNLHLDSDLESIWTHGSVTGLTIALSIFLYDKVKREWPTIRDHGAIDWTIPLTALGLTAATANAYDTHQVIQGAEPVVGMAIDSVLAKLGVDMGLEPNQTNVAYEISVAASIAFFNYLNMAKRQSLQVTAGNRSEIPLTARGIKVVSVNVAGRVSQSLEKIPPEAIQGVPGLIF